MAAWGGRGGKKRETSSPSLCPHQATPRALARAQDTHLRPDLRVVVPPHPALGGAHGLDHAREGLAGDELVGVDDHLERRQHLHHLHLVPDGQARHQLHQVVPRARLEQVDLGQDAGAAAVGRRHRLVGWVGHGLHAVLAARLVEQQRHDVVEHRLRHLRGLQQVELPGQRAHLLQQQRRALVLEARDLLEQRQHAVAALGARLHLQPARHLLVLGRHALAVHRLHRHVDLVVVGLEPRRQREVEVPARAVVEQRLGAAVAQEVVAPLHVQRLVQRRRRLARRPEPRRAAAPRPHAARLLRENQGARQGDMIVVVVVIISRRRRRIINMITIIIIIIY